MARGQFARQDVVSRKREERAIREHHRRERKIESYLAEDENFPSFSTQLGKLGLQLRDIPGDGNCLFRALGDQMEGHGRTHFKYRFDVVKYMMEHRDDFEPFVEDDIPFERHVLNLRKLGTYGGNDAIVAFARLHQVNVVIHQLNAPFIMIQGPGTTSQNTRQIHIAYHNGDHYSSVRKINDNTESPANIRVQVGGQKGSMDGKTDSGKSGAVANGYHGYEAQGVVSAMRDTDSIIDEVMQSTGCQDLALIQETLADCDYDVESTILQLLQIMEVMGKQGNTDDTHSLVSQQTSTDSGVSMDGYHGNDTHSTKPLANGIHIREDSYGGSSGYGSISSGGDVVRPKIPLPHLDKGVQMTAKQKKEAKKQEKKKRAEERHKARILGKTPQAVPVSDDESVVTVVAKDIGMMKI
ncbi:hypothetical protein FSP39_015555 [Pinctada imbricata]|uniref:OTU domain-containing protein 3 n=1 Tax=Pinctada imbricata TaxID=66713 RepID=A0AA88XPK4_PINIB|nr:hypothetical protein FSP39_015555 [Pinctada imbricata]